MKFRSISSFIFLGAVWGLAFVLVRFSVRELTPFFISAIRCVFAGVFSLGYLYMQKLSLDWRKNLKHYLVVGVLQFAIPFTLLPLSAKTLPSSYMAIINVTSPIFGALFANWIFKETLSLRKLVGFLVSILGVSCVVKIGATSLSEKIIFPTFLCLLTCISYALVGIYVKKYTSELNPLALSTGGQLLSSILLSPFAFFYLPSGLPSSWVVFSIIFLSIVCTSIAFLLYYRLISEIGTTKSFSISFLIPGFAMVWGALLLHESISIFMIFGAVLTILGVVMVVYGNPKKTLKIEESS